MSIKYFTNEVKDREKKEWEDNGTLDCLAIGMFVVGINKLHEKNIEKLINRLNRYTNELDAIAASDDGQALIWTKELVEPWLGLKTKVAPMSDATFDEYLKCRVEQRKNETEFYRKQQEEK